MNSKLMSQKEQAAELLAEGRYEYSEVSEKVGVDRKTLLRWRKDSKFSARVEQLQKDFNEAALKRGIARKEYRIRVLADKESKLRQVMEERAADESMAKIPGGTTGLIVRKAITSKDGIVGFEYVVDTGTIKALQSIHEQVAKELGQLVEKREVKADILHSLKDVPDADLDAELETILEGSSADDGPGDEGPDAGDPAREGSQS